MRGVNRDTFVAQPEIQCAGKKAHPGPDSARRVVRRMRERAKNTKARILSTLAPYRCPHCGFWHIGSLGR